MLIDTHSHLYLSQFDADRDEMLKRAQDAGIHKILLPNIDLCEDFNYNLSITMLPNTTNQNKN